MAIALRFFLFATGLVMLALAATTRGLLPPPEVRTRVGEVPVLSRSLLQQAMVPATLIDRFSLEPALALDAPSELRESPDPAAAAPTSERDRPADATGAEPVVSAAPADVPTLAFATERNGEDSPAAAPDGKARQGEAAAGTRESANPSALAAIATQSEPGKSAKPVSAKRKVGRRSGKHRKASKSAKRKTIAKPAAEDRKIAEPPSATAGAPERTEPGSPEMSAQKPPAGSSTGQTAGEGSTPATENGPAL